MAQNYYQILGITQDASADEIKRAYRRMAHQYHPDKKGGDEEKFKQVNAAYQVLSDEQKRAQYDQFGQNFDQAGGGGGFSGFGNYSVNFEDLGGVSDIFEQFFGRRQSGSRTRASVRQGNDVAIDVTLDFAEPAADMKRDTTLQLYQSCRLCHGNGAEPNTPIKECAMCRGTGSVTTSRQTMFGVFSQSSICPDCQGEGKKPETVCTKCRGEGRQRRSKTLKITIPAGIDDGQTVRIAGQGEFPVRGGIPGDLYVTVHIRPHAHLRRDGSDVRSQVELSFVEATLGATKNIPTLAGITPLKIPAGTQPGTEFKLRGQGFPVIGGGRSGDQIVRAQVIIPTKLSRKQRQLLEEFTAARKRSFF
ncbi:MAG: molecular chaperone DnaJ [Candidatus Andersenbacteria bacterium]